MSAYRAPHLPIVGRERSLSLGRPALVKPRSLLLGRRSPRPLYTGCTVRALHLCAPPAGHCCVHRRPATAVCTAERPLLCARGDGREAASALVSARLCCRRAAERRPTSKGRRADSAGQRRQLRQWCGCVFFLCIWLIYQFQIILLHMKAETVIGKCVGCLDLLISCFNNAGVIVGPVPVNSRDLMDAFPCRNIQHVNH